MDNLNLSKNSSGKPGVGDLPDILAALRPYGVIVNPEIAALSCKNQAGLKRTLNYEVFLESIIKNIS